MSFLILEINHHTAPLAIRERFAFSAVRAAEMLRQLVAKNEIHEAVLISTCNRTEMVCAGEDSHAVLEVLCQLCNVDVKYLATYWHVYHDEAALRHLVRVASGLDSMILGEPQIFGQVKEAYELANQVGSVGKVLHPFFQYVFFLSKKIRTETSIGRDPVSVAFAAVNLAKHIFADLSECKVLMIGAGETAELATQHFADYQVEKFFFVNRTLEKAERLAHIYDGSAFEFSELSTILPEADIILSAVECSGALLAHDFVRASVRERPDSRLFLDLGVPRNIELEVGNLPDCYLYTIDDLQLMVQEGIEQRQEAAKIAEDIIEREIEKFFKKQKVAVFSSEIRSFTQKVDSMIQEFVVQAEGAPDKREAAFLGERLAKKIQHEAIVFFKEVRKAKH